MMTGKLFLWQAGWQFIVRSAPVRECHFVCFRKWIQTVRREFVGPFCKQWKQGDVTDIATRLFTQCKQTNKQRSGIAMFVTTLMIGRIRCGSWLNISSGTEAYVIVFEDLRIKRCAVVFVCVCVCVCVYVIATTPWVVVIQCCAISLDFVNGCNVPVDQQHTSEADFEPGTMARGATRKP
jgi:hypothetical protein